MRRFGRTSSGAAAQELTLKERFDALLNVSIKSQVWGIPDGPFKDKLTQAQNAVANANRDTIDENALSRLEIAFEILNPEKQQGLPARAGTPLGASGADGAEPLYAVATGEEAVVHPAGAGALFAEEEEPLPPLPPLPPERQTSGQPRMAPPPLPPRGQTSGQPRMASSPIYETGAPTAIQEARDNGNGPVIMEPNSAYDGAGPGAITQPDSTYASPFSPQVGTTTANPSPMAGAASPSPVYEPLPAGGHTEGLPLYGMAGKAPMPENQFPTRGDIYDEPTVDAPPPRPPKRTTPRPPVSPAGGYTPPMNGDRAPSGDPAIVAESPYDNAKIKNTPLETGEAPALPPKAGETPPALPPRAAVTPPPLPPKGVKPGRAPSPVDAKFTGKVTTRAGQVNADRAFENDRGPAESSL